jgi:hypothetical protein
MKTDPSPQPPPVFPQIVSDAVAQLKQRLQTDYEQAYPDLREIIHLVLDEEETKAWSLSPFPHLLLPDLVETHIARLNLQPAETRDAFHSNGLSGFPAFQPAFALCS